MLAFCHGANPDRASPWGSSGSSHSAGDEAPGYSVLAFLKWSSSWLRLHVEAQLGAANGGLASKQFWSSHILDRPSGGALFKTRLLGERGICRLCQGLPPCAQISPE